jgi:choline dehydrogenase-like flavoprotein
VSAVCVDHEGTKEAYSADIVVVACGAINSALLLLRSACDKHPDGLANSSRVVGRHYMRHNNTAFMAISRQSAQSDEISEDTGPERLLFRRPRLS